MAIIYIVPVLALFTGNATVMVLGAAAWALSAAIFMPIVREYRISLWTTLCLPAIALFYTAATIESAFRYWSGRGGEWKGRVQDAR